jgi:hypothetical protein
MSCSNLSYLWTTTCADVGYRSSQLHTYLVSSLQHNVKRYIIHSPGMYVYRCTLYGTLPAVYKHLSRETIRLSILPPL